jgi:DNA polymerase III epsilon subunit-like protein|tara:strand:- start:3896 stop:4447 length:552 start_codon:yes stop_codon:yes gene_type:complete
MFKRNILIIDFEASSADTEICDPIQLGAVLLEKDTLEIIEKFNATIKPQTDDWCKEAEKVHGLNREYLQKAGELLSDVIEDFTACFNLDNVMLASWHNFDMIILNRIIKESKKNYKNLELWSYSIPYVNAKKLQANNNTGHNLTMLLNHFDLSRPVTHDALNDAILEAKVFKEITDFYNSFKN